MLSPCGHPFSSAGPAAASSERRPVALSVMPSPLFERADNLALPTMSRQGGDRPVEKVDSPVEKVASVGGHPVERRLFSEAKVASVQLP